MVVLPASDLDVDSCIDVDLVVMDTADVVTLSPLLFNDDEDDDTKVESGCELMEVMIDGEDDEIITSVTGDE